MKKTLLAFLSMAPLAISAEETQYWVNPSLDNVCYWVDGFSLKDPSTWDYDADKYNNKDGGDPSPGDCPDSHYCWAAAAANIIAQWEDKNSEFVWSTQKRAPKSAQAIYDEFIHTFVNISGETSNATAWYFTGVTTPDLLFKEGATNTEGGYYKDMVKYETIYGDPMRLENSGWTFDPESGIGIWDSSVYNLEGNDLYKQWTDNLIECIVDGYSIGIAADGIYDDNGDPGYYSHALTLWGIEVNQDGYLTRMWLTDSDDATSFGKDMGLFSVTCEEIPEMLTLGLSASAEPGEWDPVEGNIDYFSMMNDVNYDGRLWYKGYDNVTEYGDYFSAYSAIRITPLVDSSIPEPATGTLGLVALAALAARRRRK